VDEKVKRRLVKNRLSAERSRQRKNARMSDMEDQLTHAKTQLDHVRAENAELKQRLAAFEALARAHCLHHML
jgi:chromosome segregation ATPase